MLFFLSQNEDSLWWVGLDQGPGLQGQGLNVTTVFLGSVNPVITNREVSGAGRPTVIVLPGRGIQAAWADVPRGTRLLNGTLFLEPESGSGGTVEVLNVTAQTGGFTATKLTRTVFTPPQQQDIQSLFELVKKNLGDIETLASEGAS